MERAIGIICDKFSLFLKKSWQFSISSMVNLDRLARLHLRNRPPIFDSFQQCFLHYLSCKSRRVKQGFETCLFSLKNVDGKRCPTSKEAREVSLWFLLQIHVPIVRLHAFCSKLCKMKRGFEVRFLKNSSFTFLKTVFSKPS